jgi:hypothetical protein
VLFLIKEINLGGIFVKVCCVNCFNEELMKYMIDQDGFIGNCSYCKSKNVKTLQVENKELSGLFDIFTSIYSETLENNGLKMIYILQRDWDVFNKNNTWQSMGALLKDIMKNLNIDSDNSYIMNPEFQLYKNYWYEYSNEIKYKNRFYLDLPEELKSTLLSSIKYLVRPLKKDSLLYRARIGGELDEFKEVTEPYKPTIEDIGPPPFYKTKVGRANPAGIPYLYTSNSIETAIAEVRPWFGCKVTFGTFKVNETKRIIDLTKPRIFSLFETFIDLKKAIGANELIRNLHKELTKPVDPELSDIEYLPTQFLTEFIKNQGYDGITFKSSLSEGNNTVLFNVNGIEVIETDITQIYGINYYFHRPYLNNDR